MKTPTGLNLIVVHIRLLAVLGIFALAPTATAQTAPINVFEQQGVGILAVTNKHPVDIFVGVDGNWQGRVPAHTTAYIPVEGFVTRDSGFDAAGNLNIQHAFGGFVVQPRMILNYRSVAPLQIPDPANPGKTKPVWVDGADPMVAGSANAQGILWHIVGVPPYDLDPLLLESMVKMVEGRPGPDWEKLARKAGEPWQVKQQEATQILGGTGSGGGPLTLYGYRTITAQISPANGDNVIGNRVVIKGEISGIVLTDKLILRSSVFKSPIEVKVSSLNPDGSFSFVLDPYNFPFGSATVELVANESVVTATSFTCIEPKLETPSYVPTYTYEPIPNHGAIDDAPVRNDPINDAVTKINSQVNDFIDWNREQSIQTQEMINQNPIQPQIDLDSPP